MWFIIQDHDRFVLEKIHEPAPCAGTESLLQDRGLILRCKTVKVTPSGRESFMNRAMQAFLQLAARSMLFSVVVEYESSMFIMHLLKWLIIINISSSHNHRLCYAITSENPKAFPLLEIPQYVSSFRNNIKCIFFIVTYPSPVFISSSDSSVWC